jgi:hypothetical protein
MTAGIPFVLKAGTMSKFEIKLNYFKLAKSLSIFASSDSSQAEVVIQDLFMIVAPVMSPPRDNSWTAQDLTSSYKEENAYNIFTNNLQLRRKPNSGESARINDTCWE